MLKRKRVVLSLKDKINIIECLKNGESGRHLAVKYGVGDSTISDIKRNADIILNYTRQIDSSGTERKMMKKAKNELLEDALYSWFMQEKANDRPISDAILRGMALQINKETCGDDNFVASHGWLQRFKTRHNIRDLDSREENAEGDTTDIWSSFEKEIGGTARCILCQQSVPPDDATLKMHLLEKHQKLHQKREIADDDEDESQSCYTEVVYLANEANIKREPKQRTYNNHSELEKSHYTEEDEELDNFGKYITSLLKNLPKDTCMQLQMEIVNLIMTAKLKSVVKPNIGNSSKDHDPL